MGRLGKDDNSGYFSSASGDVNDRCSTRKVVKTRCHTEEVEPGRFVRKCEKTEQFFKDFVGRPSEVIESGKEYTEEDVTDQMVKDSFQLESAKPPASSYFPGLQSDLGAIERRFFGEIQRFFEASEEMKRDFFNSFRIFNEEFPSRGIPTEGEGERALPPKEDVPKKDGVEVRIFEV